MSAGSFDQSSDVSSGSVGPNLEGGVPSITRFGATSKSGRGSMTVRLLLRWSIRRTVTELDHGSFRHVICGGIHLQSVSAKQAFGPGHYAEGVGCRTLNDFFVASRRLQTGDCF